MKPYPFVGLIALIAVSLIVVRGAHATPQSERAQVQKTSEAAPKVAYPYSEQARISKFIRIYGKKSQSYADKTAKTIVESAVKFKIDPYIIAATAWKESTFTMHSRPQIGPMQFTRSTGRTYQRMGFNIYEFHDNIRAGACKLAGHYHRSAGTTASRHGGSRNARGSQRSRSVMWGAYNGCGPRGAYVKRLESAYRFMKGNTWESKAKKKS